jgi:hypothetical protein
MAFLPLSWFCFDSNGLRGIFNFSKSWQLEPVGSPQTSHLPLHLPSFIACFIHFLSQSSATKHSVDNSSSSCNWNPESSPGNMPLGRYTVASESGSGPSGYLSLAMANNPDRFVLSRSRGPNRHRKISFRPRMVTPISKFVIVLAVQSRRSQKFFQKA